MVAGGPERCLVIAEAGVNHNGDLALAEKLVDAAADAGAHVVKFQTFDPASLCAPDAPKAAYQKQSSEGQNQNEMLAQLVLSDDAHRVLKKRAEARGLVFMSTPFDTRSADMLDELPVGSFKIGSGELTHHALLKHVAAKGKPLFVSTGMATLAEVEAAMAVLSGARVTLLHCVSSYPADPKDANLRAMQTLRKRFHVPVGWSDHTLGIDVAIAAAALGAEVIEKHLTLDCSMPGPDHAASLEPKAFAEMVRSIARVTAALGTGVKAPAASELEVARVARRSLYWRRSLAEGSIVSEHDLLALRPATGLSPAEGPALIGRKLSRAVSANAQVSSTDLLP
jgi:N,N'-diacetyllegionaminate synthase